jgi:NifU-like protein involved in Fe-S cluster formation
VASASLLTERLRGSPLSAAATISERDVLTALAAVIPPPRRRCATLPLEALRTALAALRGPVEEPRE